MEALIANSVNILNEDDNIQIAYGWMDLGDVMCEKMRSNTLLKDEEYRLANKLINICKRIRLESSITLYRGTTEKFNPIIGEKQFNALSPNLNTAETYGYYIT